MPGDAASVPTQQHVGSDQPTPSSSTRQCLGDCSEQRPIAIVHCRSIDTATKYRELMTQHDDLEVLGPARSHRQPGQSSDQAIQNTTHKTTGSPAKPPVRQPRQRFRHPQARTRIATEYTDNLAKLRRSINSACARRAAPTVLVGEHLDDRRFDPCPDIRRSTVGGRSLWL